MNWTALLFILGAALLLFFTYRSVKANKAAFTRENFSKTATTLGMLALALIAFIGLLVMLLNYS